jgi:hypothetical protein
MMLQNESPQGQFGQALYPKGASALEKVGYASRGLTEAVVPGWASFAGLPGGMLPDSAIDIMPSYKFRQLAYSVKGKTPLGITGQEPASSRTIRSLLSNIGIQTYPMDLTYLSSQVKQGKIPNN